MEELKTILGAEILLNEILAWLRQETKDEIEKDIRKIYDIDEL